MEAFPGGAKRGAKNAGFLPWRRSSLPGGAGTASRLTRVRHSAGAMFAAALTVALGGCTPHHHRIIEIVHEGLVTGVAEACAGPASLSTRPVTVFASHDGRAIATELVRYAVGGGHYRLRLAPGRYRISAPRSGDRPQSVIVRSGQTITVDFPNRCD